MLNRYIGNIAGDPVENSVYVRIVVGILDNFIPHQTCDYPVIAGYDVLGASQQDTGGHFVELAGKIFQEGIFAFGIIAINKVIPLSLIHI